MRPVLPRSGWDCTDVVDAEPEVVEAALPQIRRVRTGSAPGVGSNLGTKRRLLLGWCLRWRRASCEICFCSRTRLLPSSCGSRKIQGGGELGGPQSGDPL